MSRSLFCAAVLSALSVTGLLFSPANAYQLPAIEDTPAATEAPTEAPVIVVVDKSKHITHVIQNHDGRLVSVFCAANTTGKKSTPTPDGRMLVHDKRLDPVWKPPVSIDPKQRKVAAYSKDKHNPLGVAWLGLDRGFIGLHGTNDEARIGRNASHGCVRHKNEDIRKLYSLVPVGTPVYIVQQLPGTEILPEDMDYLAGVESTAIVAMAAGAAR